MDAVWTWINRDEVALFVSLLALGVSLAVLVCTVVVDKRRG